MAIRPAAGLFVAIALALSFAAVSGEASDWSDQRTAVEAQTGFIRVSGTQFVDDNCAPYVFSGYNTWQILETAGGSCCGGRASVTSQLDQAKAANLTNVRMFAYGTAYGYNLQLTATTYNESAFKDMDFVLNEAAKRSLRVTIALSSNWVYGPNTTGTRCWYTNLTNTASDCDDFFTDANAITLYKNWVQTITSRTNTISGVQYGSDPTIFGWDLINEPRCDSTDTCSAATIQSWISNVAPYLKARVKQLVTVGEDGFMQATNCLADKTNPVTNSIGWPLQTGQDFLPNHAANGIDYGAIHFWPDNWARTDLDFGKNWLYSHSNQSATVLKKPLVVEEFGKAFGGTTVSSGLGATQQDQVTYYNLVYALVESSFNNNGIVQGLAFWRWSAAQSPGTSLAAFDNSATINTTSPTFQQVILPFSQRTAAKSSTAVTGCTKTTSSTAATPPTSTAGRRLMQAAAAPLSSLTAAQINAQVPVSVCNAFPAQPASVGK